MLTTQAADNSEDNSDGFSQIVLVDGSHVSYAEGSPILSVSDKAMIDMTNDGSGDYRTSMWQAECVALMAVFSCNWVVRRAGMVQVIHGLSIEVQS